MSAVSATQTPKKKALDAIEWSKNAFVKLISKLIKSRRMSAEAKVATELFVRNFVDELVKSNKEWIVSKIVTYAKKKDPVEEEVFSGMRRTFVDQEDHGPSVKFNFGNLETVINSAVGFIVAWGPQITGSRKNARWVYNVMHFISVGMTKVLDPEHPAFVYSKIIGAPARKILAEYKKRPEMMKQGYEDNEDEDDDDNDNNDDTNLFGDSDDDDDKPEPAPPKKARNTRPPAVPVRDMYDDQPNLRVRSPSPPPPPPPTQAPIRSLPRPSMFNPVDDLYS